jgi:hypothetical protein
MTIGRTFLLWLLGVLIVTLVLVSALVLWNEQRALEAELESQSRLLAKTLALTVAEGGSPEYLRVISTGDLRAGEARTRTARCCGATGRRSMRRCRWTSRCCESTSRWR